MAHDDGPTVPGRAEVERLLAERGDHLMRAAIALAGSRPEGEDLLQAALERLLRRWHRIEGNPEGYLRRTLYNMAADGWRRRSAWLRKLPWSRRNRPLPCPLTQPTRWTCVMRSAGHWPSCHPSSAPCWCCATGRASPRSRPLPSPLPSGVPSQGPSPLPSGVPSQVP